ncbi:hypothetical protein C2G38_2189108 [Gigaspora rosea]|uniref:Uncharacterized protein n=1 Tax=Gigaspora rosea TaxID=44941 RepID=A0A397V2W1_9GLOM|nr:hypothetical protein C2G38_2189108 [Gigaspora rosea]
MAVQSKENFVPFFEYITHTEKFFDFYLKQEEITFRRYKDLIYTYDKNEKTYDFFILDEINDYENNFICNLNLKLCASCDSVEIVKIKNKPTPILQPKNNDRTNDTTTTYTETASTTTFLTTIKPDFDFPKRPKDLLTSEESTTNSTTTIPSSSTKTTSTKTISELLEPISDSDVSCQICKIKLKQTEIEERLKEHLKNLLSKDFIHNK